MKLLALRETLHTPDHDGPEFFILGRVRMRMGFHWKPAYTTKPYYAEPKKKIQLACCPDCGATAKVRVKGELIPLTPETFPKEDRLQCLECQSPLWTLKHKKQPKNLREQLKEQLQRLPTIGPKTSENLLTAFGEDFIAQTMDDNFFELVNLQHGESGDFYFSDRQAQRLENAFAKIEFGLGQGGYQPTEFIKRYLPNKYFGLMIVDEGHEYKNYGTAQGQAMGVLCNKVDKLLLLTGTLMGGYADDVFFLLWRLMPKVLIDEGFTHRHGGLQRASMDWLKQYGCLETIYKSTDSSHKTSKGKKSTVNVRKRPGFSPVAIVKHILPYTVFMRLADIGENVLPRFDEFYHEIDMDDTLREVYNGFSHVLMQEMKKALRRGDNSLLGSVFSALMSYPDSTYMQYRVTHPRDRRVAIGTAPSLRSIDDADNKLSKLIELCKDAKANGRRVLVYTTFTNARDTTKYLKTNLDNAGFKTFVMKSTVSTEQREDWIMDKVDKGCEVLICNPELVKTGLDLLEFPTICFMQTGYNVYTLMQAMMRSYRIGQDKDVAIHFLGYANCAQSSCLQLMQKKVTVTQSTSGEIPESGLDAINTDGDESLEVAIARDLVQSMDQDGQSLKLAQIEEVDEQNNKSGSDDFWEGAEVISTYTRAEAIADGVLVDVSDTSEVKEAGFKIPVAMTRAVYEDCVVWDEAAQQKTAQDEAGRLWDVVYMLRNAIKQLSGGSDYVQFQLYCVPREVEEIEPQLVTLKALVGPGDQGEPVITIMKLNES